MSASRHHRNRRLHRALVIAAAALAVTVGTGCVYELLGARHDAQRFPQRGKPVDIGGDLTLNLNCTGSVPPTVILESGMGVSSLGWISVQPEIAKYARVCSYDRAGYGWSASSSEPRTALQIARELRALLKAAGEGGPYVLVGPSFGGFIVRVFAGQYPAEVAGLVLVEASHEDEREQVDRIISAEAKAQRAATEARGKQRERIQSFIEPLKSYLGIDRLQSALNPDTSLPPFGWSRSLMEEFRYQDRQAKTRQTVAAETTSATQSGEQARLSGGINNRPLVVLTGGNMNFRPDPLTPPETQSQLKNLWINVLQGGLAKMSTRGRHVVLNECGHLVQFECPGAVISAIHDVWAEASAADRPARQ